MDLKHHNDYNVIIIGAGPGGIFAAYELSKLNPDLAIGIFESGKALEDRECPITLGKTDKCINCKSCSIMSGFGGAGAFSDGKYNITNDFGGTLYEYIGKNEALELMYYVDDINMKHGGEGTKMYTTANSKLKKECIEQDLHLLDASVRHLGTDINYVVFKDTAGTYSNVFRQEYNLKGEHVQKVLDNGYVIRYDPNIQRFVIDYYLSTSGRGRKPVIIHKQPLKEYDPKKNKDIK
jgi:uncharacterized FAD-dependent dehydrogenase